MRDDIGRFFPVGMTLFWAVGGWHRGESVRVGQNFAFIRRQGKCDYVRLLGQVGWSGEEIDPWWSDYRETLAATIDCAYDEGLLTQLTAIGGKAVRPVDAAKVMAEVIEPRKHKVILLEAVNEANANERDAVAIARVFAPLGLPFGVGLGNKGIDVIKARGDEGNATVDYFHTERTLGDKDEAGGRAARQVRQCWDFQHFRRVAVDNEPPGIASSVAVMEDPFQMAAKRAGVLVCGGTAFCIHPGAGVFGRYFTGSWGVRHANLFEVPGLEAMAIAVSHAADHLPGGIETWQKFNTNQPVKVVTGSLNKLYGSRDGARFAEIAIGCDGPTHTLQAKVPCDLRVVNPATGDVLLDRQFAKDETAEVSGLWSYLLIGTQA